jgi:hypothetical protein
MPFPPSITPDPLRAPSMAEIERAREMYAQGFTVARCLAAGNMSHGTLYYWLDGGPFLGPTTGKPAVGLGPATDKSAGGDDAGARMLPPIPRRRAVLGKRRKPLAASTASLLARLTRTAERAALDIEQRLARPSAATPERERDLRMLASLVQSLRGLVALSPTGDAGAARKDEDDLPEDMDAFRERLARRIHVLVDAERAREQEEAEQTKSTGPDRQAQA